MLLGEEVTGLLALQLEQGLQLRCALLRCPPGERDRPPGTQVMAGGGIVDRHHPLELGQHPQEPGAAAARGAEDTDQPIRGAHALTPIEEFKPALQTGSYSRTTSVAGLSSRRPLN